MSEYENNNNNGYNNNDNNNNNNNNNNNEYTNNNDNHYLNKQGSNDSYNNTYNSNYIYNNELNRNDSSYYAYGNSCNVSGSQDNRMQGNIPIDRGQFNNKYQYYMGQYNMNPEPNTNKKAKKSRKNGNVSKVVKFIAVALVFGLLSGAVFQGYNYLFPSKEARVSDNEADTVDNNVDSNIVNNDSIVDGNPVQDNIADEGSVNMEDNQLASSEEEGLTQTVTKLSETEVVDKAIVTDVSDIAEKLMPSIVAINKTATIKDYDFFFGEFSQEVKGSGSGIIIGQNESKILIVTNNHVIEGADKVEIIFVDNSSAQAVVKGAEARSDLAILEVDMKELDKDTINAIKVAALGASDELKAGEMVVAIGNALGYGQSVTVGYISALNREIDIDNVKMTLIQTDAAINPGNSGGALINTAGEVIGINSVKLASANVEGMGYAIPITDALPMIERLINREAQDIEEQGFLGINLQTAQNVTTDYAYRFNMPIGVYVNDVVENSPAMKAGLKKGHIITGLDGMTVQTIDDMLNILSYTKPGDEVKLKINVIEAGKYVEKELTVVLDKRP